MNAHAIPLRALKLCAWFDAERATAAGIPMVASRPCPVRDHCTVSFYNPKGARHGK